MGAGRAQPWRALSLAALAAGALALPPAGTTSRERAFCRAWLALPPPAKVDVLALDGACHVARGPALRETLDAECRNWARLMDFEVRAIVDRVLATCDG
jgi:hypothetical protein